jgi:hypothetical protein
LLKDFGYETRVLLYDIPMIYDWKKTNFRKESSIRR